MPQDTTFQFATSHLRFGRGIRSPGKNEQTK